jgi:hypothetical protein
MINGTVTISLQDYESLKNNSKSGEKIKEGILKAAKELEVFLSFLCSRENIDEHIDEFNMYSKTCKIRIVEGRAKIEITNEPDTETEDNQDRD